MEHVIADNALFCRKQSLNLSRNVAPQFRFTIVHSKLYVQREAASQKLREQELDSNQALLLRRKVVSHIRRCRASLSGRLCMTDCLCRGRKQS